MSNIFRPSIYKKEESNVKKEENNSNNEGYEKKESIFKNITFSNNSIDLLNDNFIKIKPQKNKKKKSNILNNVVQPINIKNEVIEEKPKVIKKEYSDNNINEILSLEERGEELKMYVKEKKIELSGYKLIESILNKECENYNFLNSENYGILLNYILLNKREEQYDIINLFQEYCNKLEFPKVKVDENEKYLSHLIFMNLVINEIIEDSVFDKWFDYVEEDEEKDKQRKKMLLQLSEFILFFQEIKIDVPEEEEDEENNSEEKVDQTKELKEKKEDKIKKKNEEILNMKVDEDFNIDDI